MAEEYKRQIQYAPQIRVVDQSGGRAISRALGEAAALERDSEAKLVQSIAGLGKEVDKVRAQSAVDDFAVEFEEVEEKYALDDKKYLLLQRLFNCGTWKEFHKGSLGIIDTPEKEISLNSGFSVVKKRLWFGSDQVENGFAVSYKNDQYGKFNEFIFDTDGGSDSFILENGKVAEWWNTLAQE